jgi:hypothetical protein
MLTYLQLLTPNYLIGKVISCFICVSMCTSPIGQLLYGIAFEHIGSQLHLPFYLAGATMVAISIATKNTFREIPPTSTD